MLKNRMGPGHQGLLLPCPRTELKLRASGSHLGFREESDLLK